MYETVIAIIVAFACGFLLGKYDLFGKSKRKENISKSSNVLNANQSNTETASVANTPKLRLKRKAKVESQNGAADISPAPASVEMVVASGGTVDSPVNDSLNNRVRARSESHDATLRPLIDNATILLLDIIGVKRSASSNYGKRPWELVRTGPSSHFWLSSSKVDGVLLRGTSIAVSDAKDVLYFLSRQSECIGMESIADTYEVLYVSEDKKTTLYRIRCKTNSITSWVRDFVIINNVVEKPDGTVIMVSQSLPDDYVTMLCGPKSLRSNKRSVRGILYCSGYVLRPLKSGEGNGCEVSYGCHIDFKGSKGLNTKKMDALMCHMQVIMEQLQQGVVDHTRASPMDLDLGLGPSNNPTSPKLKSKNHSKHNPPHQHQLAAAAAASSSLNSQLTQGPSRDHDKETRSESKPEEETCTSQYDMNIDEDQRLELLSASKHAMSRLRNLNTSVTEIGTHNTGWDTFFESDGVSVSENSNADGEPGGPIEARCTIDASPNVVRRLLRDNPHAIDTLLEGRTILASLDHLHGEDAAHKTYVQWLAYAPIWPVGARDFLVVTSEEYFDVVNKEGFIIASTSVDDICEEEEIFENKREMEDGKCERKLHTDIYTRSCLRLAGYVGSPNGKGGTDLRIFVDVDMVSYIPSWLLQVLAQYGLSEMMNRIRIATSPEVLAQSADSSELFTAPYKLEKVISQIQQREEKRLQKIGDIGGSSSVAATAMKPFPVKEISSDRKISIDGLSGETADVVSLTTADEPELKLQDPIKILSKKLSCESIPLLKIYIGIETSPDYTFEWTHKLSKNGITIHTSPVPNSSWVALRAECIIPNVSKYAIFDVLSDDSRMGEYDDMYDGMENIVVTGDRSLIRRMYFKAIWPTAPRDMIANTTWEEHYPYHATKHQSLRKFSKKTGATNVEPSAVSTDDESDVELTKLSEKSSLFIASRSPLPDESHIDEVSGYVRGYIPVSGYWLQPVPAGAPLLGLNPRDQVDDFGDAPLTDVRLTLTAHTELGGSLPTSVINMLSCSAPVKVLSAIKEIIRRQDDN